MSLFDFKIWRKKTIQIFEEGELIEVPHPTDNSWVKRTLYIETDQIRITSFQEAEIYADELKSKNCVEVFFTDDDSVYGAYSLEAFKKLYNESYLPLIPKDLNDIVRDLGGDPE